MKALVTGARGFLGTHLCAFLKGESVDVFTLGVGAGDERHFSIASVTDAVGIEKAINKASPDLIFHLAGTSQGTIEPMREVNVGFARLLLRAASRSAARTLVVGTASEYGPVEPLNIPTPETYAGVPTTAYGITKLEQTRLALEAADRGQHVVAARPFNIIGAGMGEHLLPGRIAKELAQAHKLGSPSKIKVGSLAATRDFIDVSHVVQSLWLLMQSPSSTGEVVNVCTGQELSLRTFVGAMVAASGLDVQVIEDQGIVGNSAGARSAGDPARLFALTGFRPHFDIQQSARKLISQANS